MIGQIYVTCAVLAAVALPMPLYVSTTDRVGLNSLSIWSLIVEDGEGVSIAAALLIAVTVAVLLTAAHLQERSMVAPLAVLAVCVIGLLMIFLNPARPSATAYGPALAMLTMTSIVAGLTALVHFIRATSRR